VCAVLQLIAFTEVGIMHRLRHIPGVCKLHDYGIDQEHIYLVMTKYSCCLRDWREKQKGDPSQQLNLYLNIFCQLVELVQVKCMPLTRSNCVVNAEPSRSFC